MAESKPAPANEEDALAQRLADVQSRIEVTEKLRKTHRNWSWLGVLLILFFLGLFVFRLYDHLDSSYVAPLNDEAQREEFLKKLIEESQAEDIVKEEIHTLITQLTTEIIPEMQSKLGEEFVTARPEIEKAVMEAVERLQLHATEHVELRLLEALTKGLEGLGDDLQDILPKFSVEQIEKQLASSRELFIDKLANVIEERIARVRASVENLDDTVKKSVELAKKDKMTLERANSEFLEALVDLLVYELKPELGEVLVKQ